MMENVTISKPSALSISINPIEGVSILVIAPDEYDYRPPDVPNVPATYTVTDLVEYTESNTTESVNLFRVNLLDSDDPNSEIGFTMDSYDAVYFDFRKDSVNKHIVYALIDVPAGSYSFSGTITDSAGATTAFSKNLTVTTDEITE